MKKIFALFLVIIPMFIVVIMITKKDKVALSHLQVPMKQSSLLKLDKKISIPDNKIQEKKKLIKTDKYGVKFYKTNEGQITIFPDGEKLYLPEIR